ncbi:hypothetical protein QYE76_067662 [Lolium multiflorum]|uniref:Cytochrome c domain-containing protein n=1 Tax=Lolium multiflorum TaxID=4521 RepID=A0AAD8SEW4_LOLMU|nr:hypothetical protein QYE76_067662 [Lolium multiflorum]
MASFSEAPPGNPAADAKIFKTKCAQCHTNEQRAGHKQGHVYAVLTPSPFLDADAATDPDRRPSRRKLMISSISPFPVSLCGGRDGIRGNAVVAWIPRWMRWRRRCAARAWHLGL